MKSFNTTAVCVPSKHYMVDISAKIAEIKTMVDQGMYFTINRARQYGKTTTINALKNVLEDEYVVLSLSFERISNEGFSTEDRFVKSFAKIILDKCEFLSFSVPENVLSELQNIVGDNGVQKSIDELYRTIKRWIVISEKPIVLIIDEVDSATNNQVFLDFLAQLRDGYISRETDNMPAFKSVILAGVTDVKHLKSKIREEDEHKQNSPWNIATDFNVDMSLSESGIAKMLEEYDNDHSTGMNISEMAKLIRDYTNGYPFLVSRICQLIDKIVVDSMGGFKRAWTRDGLDEAIKVLLSESNTLFESLTSKLNNYPELKASLRRILMEGERITYNPLQDSIAQMEMYGFIRNDHNTVRVSNRIFETLLYNYFLSDEELKDNVFSKEGGIVKNQFVNDGKLDMPFILERFIQTYMQVFGPLDDKFKEKDGRELFLLFIKPIINGTGNYYIEAQTRNQTRTDLIIDYLGHQYIIELKIWRGERYNSAGEEQLVGYLEHFDIQTGYMLSFNFNKKKEVGVKRLQIGDKVLFEAVI